MSSAIGVSGTSDGGPAARYRALEDRDDRVALLRGWHLGVRRRRGYRALSGSLTHDTASFGTGDLSPLSGDNSPSASEIATSSESARRSMSATERRSVRA